jgi:hypothetical protein
MNDINGLNCFSYFSSESGFPVQMSELLRPSAIQIDVALTRLRRIWYFLLFQGNLMKVEWG